jgi:HTH-type transcriptional regulator / antitoxin HipB
VRIRAPVDLGLVIRERRTKLGLGQHALAEQVGVSRQWIVGVEKGKPRAELGLVLRTLAVLGVGLSVDAVGTMGRGAAAAIPLIDIDAVVDGARGKPR